MCFVCPIFINKIGQYHFIGNKLRRRLKEHDFSSMIHRKKFLLNGKETLNWYDEKSLNKFNFKLIKSIVETYEIEKNYKRCSFLN